MNLLKKIKKLNPEQNAYTRTWLYVIGFGGTLHLITLWLVGLREKDWVYSNPLFAMDIDKVFPASKTSVVIYILSWLWFSGLMIIVYRLLRNAK